MEEEKVCQPGRVYTNFIRCFLMRQYEATGGTEMNSRVQLPICFSTSRWNGHRRALSYSVKLGKYAHTIFIGTDYIMNRPPSSRFPDHPHWSHILLHLENDWNIRQLSTFPAFCFLTELLRTGSLRLWYPFHKYPDQIIAPSPVRRSPLYFEYV